jgi:hypothetical protein
VRDSKQYDEVEVKSAREDLRTRAPILFRQALHLPPFAYTLGLLTTLVSKLELNYLRHVHECFISKRGGDSLESGQETSTAGV